MYSRQTPDYCDIPLDTLLYLFLGFLPSKIGKVYDLAIPSVDKENDEVLEPETDKRTGHVIKRPPIKKLPISSDETREKDWKDSRQAIIEETNDLGPRSRFAEDEASAKPRAPPPATKVLWQISATDKSPNTGASWRNRIAYDVNVKLPVIQKVRELTT